MAIYGENKKARFDYEILEKFEAGLVLTGQEVKSVRGGHISLKGGFVVFHNGEAQVINVHIPKYRFAAALPSYNPERSRKLLLKKKEINYLRGKAQEEGLTILPLSVYDSASHVKMQIGIGRGKKKWDKRESIKRRDSVREVRKRMKGI